MNYDTKTIQKACRLYRAKVPVRQILRETGIKSHSVIYFHCNPVSRKRIVKRAMKWRKDNPEAWQKINHKAVKKFQKKHGKKA